MVVDGLRDSPGPCLGFLSFTQKLDLVEKEEPVMNASSLTQVVESVFELRKPEFFLAVDDPSQTN